MAWQADSITGYRDLVNQIIQMATSKHVSAVAINSGGTGYTEGDILTITHASALLDCTVEVTSVATGVIDGIKLRNMGAFSNRIASAVVNAGGTGYAVGDILEIEDGTWTQKAKVKVATLSATAVATVTIQDGGGAYSVLPGTTGATTNNNPGSGTGTGCTLNLTTQAIVGTTGISGTGGTGSSATFNLTLTDTGWTAVRDWNNYTFNSLTDEREIVLEGTAGTGDDPYVGFRSYSDEDGVDDRFGLVLYGMTSFNSGLPLASQPNIGPAIVPALDDASHLLCFDSTQDVWYSITGRKIGATIKTQGGSILAYQPMYIGLLNPFGTATENPYPMFISGTSAINITAPDEGDSNTSSFLNPQAPPSNISSPVWYYRLTDTTWVQVVHRTNDSTINDDWTIYPVGKNYGLTGSLPDHIVDVGAFAWHDGICLQTNATATRLLYPSPDTSGDLFLLVPCCLIRTPTTTSNGPLDDVHGELDNIFWISGTNDAGGTITVEDTVTIGTDRYIIFRDCHNDERYSFFCMKEA